MTKEKVPPPQPSEPKKDPATQAEPLEQVSDGAFEMDIDLSQVAPATPVGAPAQASVPNVASPAESQEEIQGALAKRVRQILRNPLKGVEAGNDEINATQLTEVVWGPESERAKALGKSTPSAVKMPVVQLTFESLRARVEGLVEVDTSDIVEAEPIPLVDAKGNPRHAVIERGPGGKPVVRDLASTASMTIGEMVESVSATKTIDLCLERISEIERIMFPPSAPEAEFGQSGRQAVIDEASKPQLESGFIEILKAVGALRASAGISDYQRKLLGEVEEMVILFAERDSGGNLLASALNSDDTVKLSRRLRRVRGQLEIEQIKARRATPPPLPGHGPRKAPPAVVGMDRPTLEKLRKARSLLQAGKIREAKPILDEVCNSAKAYTRLWGALETDAMERKNFMVEKEEPHPLVADFVENEASLERFRANNPSIRLIELGSGIGNDALYWMRHLPNLRQYYGIEISRQAAQVSRERIAKVLGEEHLPNLRAEVLEADFVKKLQLVNLERDSDIEWLSPVSTTIVSSISTLHYFWEENLKNLLLEIRNLLITTTKGYLVLALKTPDSDTWKGHRPVLTGGGYNVGLHEKEGLIRSFITPEKINDLLDKSGFDMKNATSYRKVVLGYDTDSSCEVFWNVIAQPKDPKQGK